MDVLAIKNLKLKRSDAIEMVKKNLKRYALLKQYPLDYLDRLQSFSSSLIRVSDNPSYHSNQKQLKMLRELKNEEEDNLFIEKYDYLLSSLVPENSSNLFRIYFEHEKIIAIREENQNIYYLINKSYEMLACLDEDIDYTIDDYAAYIHYELSLKNRGGWSVKKEVLKYIEGYKDGIYRNEIDTILEKIPEDERNCLNNYINQEDTFYTSYDYRRIKRGILTFAYLYKRIDFNVDDFKRELKLTGGGWKKYFEKCKLIK